MTTTYPHPIFCANPGAEFQEDREDLLSIISDTLSRGNYILGPEVEAFEKEFATYIGGVNCIGVANGTDAIYYSLRALGINPGDEVISVSHTAVATISAIELLGAVPVMADIDPNTRCMCVKSLESLISKDTKAIVVVHIYGQPADIEKISIIASRNNIPLIEDCAQAHGATVKGRRVGTFGEVSTFSFYPTKNLGALGDGGAIVVNNEKSLADSIRILRQYGWEERYISKIAGGNSRLDELQASILRYRLKKLDVRNQRRLQIAKFYIEKLTGKSIKPPTLIEDTTHVMHQFAVESENREALKNYLAKKNIFAAMHYPMAVHQQPAYLGRLKGSDKLYQTEYFYKRLLSLPVYPQLTDAQVEYIGECLSNF